MNIQSILQLFAEHRTDYEQRSKSTWNWHCQCGIEEQVATWEDCRITTDKHWAAVIVKQAESEALALVAVENDACAKWCEHISEAYGTNSASGDAIRLTAKDIRSRLTAPQVAALDEERRKARLAEAKLWHNVPASHDCKQFPERDSCSRIVFLSAPAVPKVGR